MSLLISNRLDSNLLELAQSSAPTFGMRTATSAQSSSNLSDFLLVDRNEQKVAVRITAHNPNGLLTSLTPFDFQVSTVDQNRHFVEGWLPIANISELESQIDSLVEQGLMGVLSVYRPMGSAGPALSQADFMHQSDRVRTALPQGYDGTGVKIGVISDSHDVADVFGRPSLTTLQQDIANGELPASIEVIDPGFTINAAQPDEGRAMMQLIHDLAPGASLAFATGIHSRTTNEFGPSLVANNIRALANAGADIIVDDVYWLQEPFFQDGVIAAGVNEVVTQKGVAYFSAAGNFGNTAYDSKQINFVPTQPTGDKVFDTVLLPFLSKAVYNNQRPQFYDFDPGPGVDVLQRIKLPAGWSSLWLQWDDPFFTTNGVDTDLDVFLFNATRGSLVRGNLENSTLSQSPLIHIPNFNSTGETAEYDLLIALRPGTQAPGRIKYLPIAGLPPGEKVVQEYATNSPTIWGHPGAVNSFAVGATDYFAQDEPTYFTSAGPVEILFNPDGTRKATPEIRQKPTAAAVQGTNTTFFGDLNPLTRDPEGDGFPNFSGTSASAPHAAAIAALVKQANPNFTPQQIYDRLTSTAKDIGAPGYDNLTGYGLIDAYRAVFGPPVPAKLNFIANFEDGDLPRAFETNSTGAGRIQVTTENNPIGTRQLRLDSAGNGISEAIYDFLLDEQRNSLNEAILHIDGTSADKVELSFVVKETNSDTDNPMPETFKGSVNADGVALSVDGVNWYRLVSLTGNNATNKFQPYTFNLCEFAQSKGLTLGSDVQIKFQQFSNSLETTDGIVFDNIGVTRPGKTIQGKPGRETLVGTDGSDTFIASQGRDILTGGFGNDVFRYRRLADKGDTITDFVVGSDKIDLTHLLDDIRYRGTNPIASGHVRFEASGLNTILTIDRNGFSGNNSGVSFLTVLGVSVDQFNDPSNFIFS
jgi:subtilisin family serine protease